MNYVAIVNKCNARNRRGVVLILVLVVIALLGLAAYSLTERMIRRYELLSLHLVQLQQRELALSGANYSAVVVGGRMHQGELEPIWNNVSIGPHSRTGYSFSICRSLPIGSLDLSYGLENESAKLNLNTLPLEIEAREGCRKRLTHIPSVTVHIADAILDWMDEDNVPSQFGAESVWYSANSREGFPKQRRFEDLRELLTVKGITPDLLYGEDLNQNGFQDVHETDLDGDGEFEFGLAGYLTVVSAERNLTDAGLKKININNSNLVQLYRDVAQELGEEEAQFILALRLVGPVYPKEPPPPEKPEDAFDIRLRRIQEAAKRMAAKARSTNSSTPASIGGLDVSGGPNFDFSSLMDLVGAVARIEVSGEQKLVESPWQYVRYRENIDALQGKLSVTSEERIVGRININAAPVEVLESIPSITAAKAKEMVEMRATVEDLGATAWLYEKGLANAAQMRAIGPYITTGGDIRSGISMGMIKGKEAAYAIAFEVDATQAQPKVSRKTDLGPIPMPHVRRSTDSIAN